MPICGGLFENCRLVLIASESLNVVNCEKCLRSVGLWLYKTEPNLFDDKKLKQERPRELLLVQLSHIEEEESPNNYLSEVHSYSNELVIENLLKNMVKCIEVNQQAELKLQSSSPLARAGPAESKKRKPSNSEKDADSTMASKRMCFWVTSVDGDESSSTSRRATDNNTSPSIGVVAKKEKSKLFDPLSEHFSYCPWLKIEHADQTICQIHYDIIKRYLSKRKDQNAQEDHREDKNGHRVEQVHARSVASHTTRRLDIESQIQVDRQFHK